MISWADTLHGWKSFDFVYIYSWHDCTIRPIFRPFPFERDMGRMENIFKNDMMMEIFM
jgi:hypothetical protein